MPRLAGLALFVALCALVTHWVLVFSAMRTIPVPTSARLAQTEPVETGAVATLFGGSAQSGVRDVQLIGVVADLDGVGPAAAILSLDGGPPKAVRVGASLSAQIRLTEIHGRNIVIERNGVRQEIALPVQNTPTAGRPGNLGAAPPAGAGAPLSTPMPAPVAAERGQRAGPATGVQRIPGAAGAAAASTCARARPGWREPGREGLSLSDAPAFQNVAQCLSILRLFTALVCSVSPVTSY
jgi:general secretion pathway protein C